MVRIILITFLLLTAVIGQALIFKVRPAPSAVELMTSDEAGDSEPGTLSQR